MFHSSVVWNCLQFSLNKSPFTFCSTCSSGHFMWLMLTRQTGVVVCDKSEHSQRKASPNSPPLLMNGQVCQSPWSMGVTRKWHQPICLNCVQWPVISMGLCRNVCVSVCLCLKKNKCCAKPLPVWNGGPIMRVSFSTQPCKTKLHEIDYPHTWISFVTISPSLYS